MTAEGRHFRWRGLHAWEWLGVACIALVLTLQSAVFLRDSTLRFFAPHDNNHPESMLVWQTMQLARTGEWPYGDISQPPHDLAVYGPVFYGPPALAVRVLGLERRGVFMAGRLYSLLSAVALLVIAGVWLRRRQVAWGGVAALVLVFGASRLAVVFISGFRPDHIATLLALGGLLLMRKAGPGRFFGVLLMAAALFTKANFIAAPLTLGLVWAVERRWRDLLVWGGVGLGVCVVFLLLSSLVSGGAFWGSAVMGPRLHGFDGVQWMQIFWRDIPSLLLPWSLMVCAAVWVLGRDRTDLLAWYFFISLLTQLFGMAKIGANINYLAEPLSAGALLFGLFAGRCLEENASAETAAWRRASLAMALVPLLLVAIEGYASWSVGRPDPFAPAEQAQRELIANLRVPEEAWVLSNEAGLWPRLGQPAVLDLYHFRLMVGHGRLSTRPVERMLENGEIAFVVVRQPGGERFDSAWLASEFTSAVARKIEKHYRMAGRSGPYLIATPNRPTAE